jgi:hypothetical protein
VEWEVEWRTPYAVDGLVRVMCMSSICHRPLSFFYTYHSFHFIYIFTFQQGKVIGNFLGSADRRWE